MSDTPSSACNACGCPRVALDDEGVCLCVEILALLEEWADEPLEPGYEPTEFGLRVGALLDRIGKKTSA